MSQHRFLHLALVIALGMLAAACTEDPLYPSQAISVSGADMPALAGDAVYELWLSYPPERARKDDAIDHDETIYFSAGRFLVDAAGAIRGVDGGPAAFAIPQGYNPSLVGEAIVSVEPRVDDDTIPDAPMLSGRVFGTATRGHATLEVSTAKTFDTTALLERSGAFVLEAPTSSAAEDTLSGIWLLRHQFNPASGEPNTPGINLPSMPLNHDNDNWIYEAWLTTRTASGIEYLTLGRFRNPASSDATGPGPAAGPNIANAYRYPGEDFVAPHRRLDDSTYGVVVSMQPESIPLSAPLIRLLERPTIGGGIASGETVNMSPAAKLPLIEVTIDR
jgi:hypothetical protein